MPFVGKSAGEDNANLYKHGVNEGSRGELLGASPREKSLRLL
jgi:hypothetical protein